MSILFIASCIALWGWFGVVAECLDARYCSKQPVCLGGILIAFIGGPCWLIALLLFISNGRLTKILNKEIWK